MAAVVELSLGLDCILDLQLQRRCITPTARLESTPATLHSPRYKQVGVELHNIRYIYYEIVREVQKK